VSRHPGGPAATAARLTWGALAGRALDDDDRARLGLGLGGVVLFERNVGTPEELRALTAEIRAASRHPVRISMDQEGGHIVRVGEPLTRFPGPMGIAATGSVRLARQVAAASARELRSLGVDTVLAPVLDVASSLESAAVGARSFGDVPASVARFGAASVRGYLEGGVVPVPKHLPGHGRTAEDSHVALPRVADGLDLLERDLVPFAAAVDAASPALMTGHVVYDALDPARPASISAATVRLARRRLRFDGLLVTDSLVMDAITHRMRLEDAGALAIAAGMDVAMAIEGQRRILVGLADAIAAGSIPDGRLRAAAGRVADLDRLSALLPGRRLGEPLPERVVEPHARVAREVAARSLTLVADAKRILPLHRSTSVLVVDVLAAGGSPIEGVGGAAGAAAERLVRSFPRSVLIRCDASERAGSDAAVTAASAAGAVILLTRDGFASPSTVALGRRLAAGPAPLVHVAVRNPLDLAQSPAAARVAAYADTPATIDALGASLSGRAPFPGRLPVALEQSTAPTTPDRSPVPVAGLLGASA